MFNALPNLSFTSDDLAKPCTQFCNLSKGTLWLFFGGPFDTLPDDPPEPETQTIMKIKKRKDKNTKKKRKTKDPIGKTPLPMAAEMKIGNLLL